MFIPFLSMGLAYSCARALRRNHVKCTRLILLSKLTINQNESVSVWRHCYYLNTGTSTILFQETRQSAMNNDNPEFLVVVHAPPIYIRHMTLMMPRFPQALNYIISVSQVC